ncbi:DUF362 domain-containing protein [Acetohalobium arabaticum]|uniref:Ferredoxin n=1 Tax=Acetohalobium arabaticum (strain ATCC 49924 / DSM 5501 / Z-7288) TaxID=574087 RepID=D9QT11_ACEAZ|nr:4Fe-4S binding protein [Acetohalobium arabaticum]ADL13511.1 4Fe-4S ferredoxin iron-sulfur binding domain protein [Acetohalobium arabaticum DSM 5501]
MAYTINDECVDCGTCVEECPVDAIIEGDDHFEIDEDECVECGNCLDACPVEAIEE